MSNSMLLWVEAVGWEPTISIQELAHILGCVELLDLKWNQFYQDYANEI